MDKLRLLPLPIDGAFEVEGPKFEDSRGYFNRLFELSELKDAIGNRLIVNINYSFTLNKGTIRGMHFQHPPNAELKMIRCLRGKVWDVIVDIRKDSPSFLRWESVELNNDKNNMLIVPEGVAHGFQTLENNTEILYLHTAAYSKKLEDGLRFNDPVLNIPWPLPVIALSERDKNHPLIDKNQFEGISI